ncbi:winged helix-turn-helix domain-containing protein [Elizabethkingia anophelis]|uniref:winged helix-turn-helix domain-containing protein n=1 Tax=Elizabethkingia anophelis TaxID=1117645 RepID=UPI00389286DB|nr:YcaQ family DNA glycosylase [Elizabethkingia anophelis]
MKKILTLQDLQRITLESQGLAHSPMFGTGKNAVVNALEHLGYVQIYTLSVVERAHHHTLWSRIDDYKTHYLNDLLKERKVFEYWFHAASYLPMKDYRYALPQMLSFKHNESQYYNADPKVMQYVIDTIRTEGPRKAKDFENEGKAAGNWWNWRPAKLALEKLFMQGDLMVSGRDGMQKIYDISERVLPQTTNLTIPTSIELAEYLVKTHLRAYGLTSLKQITHLRSDPVLRKNVEQVLQSMVEDKVIQKTEIDGISSMYIQKDLIEKGAEFPNSEIKLLSPFDNSLIHRDRFKQLFNFDFRLECYLPKEKRQYGYFCLPILYGNIFIGRVDCKAHRSIKKLELINMHIENTNIDIESWIGVFVEAIERFANFNGCNSITLTKVSPSKYTKLLMQALYK